ncbi:hypothetical protein [Baekduia soli]|uniref:hypothetical protein n=1 Tax=Baekduia soli TaxID=496014 RepID=UPI001651F2F8|nr:hypothetical protein [Baekduia soli]
MSKVRGLAVAVVMAVAAGPAVAIAAGPAPVAQAAAAIVLHGRLQHMRGLTATYTSSRGTFAATWIGKRHYRLTGRIGGRALSGTFRTRQASGGTRYVASGSGRLGSRPVRISGGGPDDLSRATLILR